MTPAPILRDKIIAKRFAHQGMRYSRARFASVLGICIKYLLFLFKRLQNWCGVICFLAAIYPHRKAARNSYGKTNKFYPALFLILFLAPFVSYGADSVFINEIAWMGSPPKTGETNTQASNNEWIELHNVSDSSISLNGWILTAEDGTPNISLSGNIAASSFFLLERTSDDTVAGIAADQIYTGALSNSGERLILKNSSGAVIDEVNASSGWLAGDNETKATMQKSGSIWITATGTPRAINVSRSVNETNLNSGQVSGSGQSAPVTYSVPVSVFSYPKIKAYAGEDRIIVVGSEEEFTGAALGIKDEPLAQARFWWNFGDGETKEGRVVSHVFKIPGKYTVGLHVSSGEYSASDYFLVEAVPNQLAIKSVLGGESGFIRFQNLGTVEIDIGNWIIEDSSGQKFTIPVRTKIGAKSEIAFANTLTALLKDAAGLSLVVRYPNSSEAFQWSNAIEQKNKNETSENNLKAESGLPREIKKDLAQEPTPASLSQEAKTDEPTAPVSEDDSKNNLAGISDSVGNGLFFFIALGLSIAAAAGFLIFRTILR